MKRGIHSPIRLMTNAESRKKLEPSMTGSHGCGNEQTKMHPRRRSLRAPHRPDRTHRANGRRHHVRRAARASLAPQLPAMLRSVMGTTKDDEPVGVVASSFGTQIEMMRVEEHAVAATWDDAAPAVAAHHFPPNARRNRLAGPTALTHVGLTHVGAYVTQVLRIAGGHFDDLRADFDLLAAPLLPTTAARFAHTKRNLVVRAAIVRRTAENVAGQGEQRPIVVEGRTRIAAHLGDGFADVRQRFRRDLGKRDRRRTGSARRVQVLGCWVL
jgi:hypothetical protein